MKIEDLEIEKLQVELMTFEKISENIKLQREKLNTLDFDIKNLLIEKSNMIWEIDRFKKLEMDLNQDIFRLQNDSKDLQEKLRFEQKLYSKEKFELSQELYN